MDIAVDKIKAQFDRVGYPHRSTPAEIKQAWMRGRNSKLGLNAGSEASKDVERRKSKERRQRFKENGPAIRQLLCECGACQRCRHRENSRKYRAGERRLANAALQPCLDILEECGVKHFFFPRPQWVWIEEVMVRMCGAPTATVLDELSRVRYRASPSYKQRRWSAVGLQRHNPQLRGGGDRYRGTR